MRNKFPLKLSGALAVLFNGNTITNLIPTMYEALDVVSRELVGLIPAVSRDTAANRVAVNQNVNIYVAPAASAYDITPATTAPDNGDNSFGNVQMTITKSRMVPVRWTGEEQLSIAPSGQQQNVMRDQFAQAFRTLTNEIEADLAALHIYFSRAAGTAGTTPFGTANVLTDSAGALRILEDNGAPKSDLHMVVGSAAMEKLRGIQSSLFKVNEAGTDELLRRGAMGNLHNFWWHNSGGITSLTKGTASGATTNNAGYAIGATTITLASAGTGTIVAGDVITFAGDTNQYVVLTGDSDVFNGGSIVLAEPGLRKAIAASATNITVQATSVRNMAFHRSAIALATRTPAMPKEGDAAFDVFDVTDPVSGLVFQVAAYREYRRVRFEIGIAWGQKVIAPRHTALLLG